jgi:dTDP-4-dehydrorhamnose reductase
MSVQGKDDRRPTRTGPSEPLLLVLGASGQVGRQILAQGTERQGIVLRGAARSDPDPAYRFELDRPDTVARVILGVGPDHVVLTAAATNVAWCEAHPAESRTINVLGPQAAARAARQVGATVTFISTDYVFDGTSGPYGERDALNPLNIYGLHKLQAERSILDSSSDNLIVRSCQVFGSDRRRVNFVLRVVDRLRNGEVIEAAGDLFGTPTYSLDLAAAIIQMTIDRAAGVWHVAGGTFLSRYELARRVAGAFGFAESRIEEVAAELVADPVTRPRRAGLVNDRLTAAGLQPIRALDDALTELARQEMIA